MYVIYVALIDQNLLSPFLLSSDLKIKECESVVLTFVVSCCETWLSHFEGL